MKKSFFLLTMALCLAFASTAMASGPLAPVAEGNDVLFPSVFIATGGTGEVRCAYHDLTGTAADQPMQQRGNGWAAIGGRGLDIHPFVLGPDGKKTWCKIEEIWSTDAAFVKWRPAGPCIHVD